MKADLGTPTQKASKRLEIKREANSLHLCPSSSSEVYYDSFTWVWRADANCSLELIHFELAYISTAALPHQIISHHNAKLGQAEFLDFKLSTHSFISSNSIFFSSFLVSHDVNLLQQWINLTLQYKEQEPMKVESKDLYECRARNFKGKMNLSSLVCDCLKQVRQQH